MEKIKKSRIWWAIRHFWHSPHHYMECQKPDTFWSFSDYGDKSNKDTWFRHWAISYYRSAFDIKSDKERWEVLRGIFISHLRGLWYRMKYAPRYYLCLCCNGNNGGWRTKFCEWLETKAREAEDKERT